MSKSEDFGQLIFDHLKASVVFEEEDWAIDRVERVNARLHAARPRGNRLKVVIPWLETVSAFTLPGRYIFISRSLFQLLRSDEMAAFVIAHEMAHHDLGHLSVIPDWLQNRTVKDKGLFLFALMRRVERLLHGPEMEEEADVYALNLCMNAGYDGGSCLELFDILEKHALDMRDHDAVFVKEIPAEVQQLGKTWAPRLLTWLQERNRGYVTLTERRETLEDYLQWRATGRQW